MVAIARRSAPTRFIVPSATRDGPEQDLLERADRADLDPLAARQLGVVRLGAPVEAAARAPRCARASGEPTITASAPQAIALAMSPDRPIAAVGDDVDVAAAGLVEVVAAGRGDVGDRRGHRHGDAQHGARRVRRAAAEADQHAGRAGAHQVQRGLVGRAAADDDRHVELVDELLEVERLGPAGDVLGARPSCRG